MKRHLVISTTTELVRVAPEKILYITSDGNYSNLLLCGGEGRLLTFQLGQIEKMIAEQLGSEGSAFIRIGKSLIINQNYIFYINSIKQQLVLADDMMAKYTLNASKEALKQLKELIEKQANIL